MRRLLGILVVMALAGGLLAGCAPAAAPVTPTAPAKAPAAVSTPQPAGAAPATPTIKPAAASPTTPPRVEKLKMVIPTGGFSDLFTIVAEKKGFYREEGFELEKMTMRSDVGIKAMIAGEVEYSRAIGSVLRAAAEGLPVKGIMAAQNRPPWLLVSRPEIKTVAELKGKSIAVEGVGGSTHVAVKAIVKHYGLDPENDIVPVNLGDNANRLASLKGGSVQGAILEVAFAIRAESEGMRILANAAEITEQIMGGLGTTDKRIKENPDQVFRFVRAHVKGLKYIQDPKNRDELIQIMVDELKLTKEDAIKTYEMGMKGFSEDGGISEEVVKIEIENAKAVSGMTKDVPVSQVFDYTFVNRVKVGMVR